MQTAIFSLLLCAGAPPPTPATARLRLAAMIRNDYPLSDRRCHRPYPAPATARLRLAAMIRNDYPLSDRLCHRPYPAPATARLRLAAMIRNDYPLSDRLCHRPYPAPAIARLRLAAIFRNDYPFSGRLCRCPDPSHIAAWSIACGANERSGFCGLCELCVDRRRRHPSNRLKSSAALVPPKPNELDSAYSIAIGRALFGT